MSDFNRAELRELRLRARPVSVDAGEFLFREAEAGECLYLIRRGQIEILSGQTSLRRIALRGKGEVIGEMALLDAGQRSASARATGPSLLLSLERSAFEDLLARKPRLAMRLSQLLTHRIRDFQQEVSAQLDPQGTLGTYVLQQELARGGMGSIFRAQCSQSQRIVAIKTLGAQFRDDEKMRQRFQREGQLLSRLRHPNIVEVYEYGQAAGSDFLVMELLQGETLEQRLKRGPLSWPEVGDWFLPVLSALHHAHGQRICHRDLKPANILRSHLGVVKLIDFGLALQEAQQRLSQTGEYLGTPNYFAPERSSPHAPEVEPFSDQYALGVSLFEAVTGRLPFQASDPIAMLHHHLHSRPPRPGEFRSDCPAELELAILKLLNKEPHQRFANLKELEQVLAVSLGLTPNSDPDPLSQTMAFE